MQSVTGPGRVVAGRYELLDCVGHGAMGTDANQTNKNLLLSNEAHVDTGSG